MAKVFRNVVNDGSRRAPELDMQIALWSLHAWGSHGKEWTLEEKFMRIAEAGFTGVLTRFPTYQEGEALSKLADRHGLSFGLPINIWNGEQLKEAVEVACSLSMQYINCHVMDYYASDEEAIRLLSTVMEMAQTSRIPIFVETHRGRVTQDLKRTVAYVNALSDLRLTIDFSHYVVAGEIGGTEAGSPVEEACFEALLQRTSSIHGRVSNGEQVQVELSPEGFHPMAARFAGWWSRGMANWLLDAQPGDKLPVVCEFLAFPYAIAREAYLNPPGTELADRWQQSLLMKQLLEGCWREASISIQ